MAATITDIDSLKIDLSAIDNVESLKGEKGDKGDQGDPGKITTISGDDYITVTTDTSGATATLSFDASKVGSSSEVLMELNNLGCDINGGYQQLAKSVTEYHTGSRTWRAYLDIVKFLNGATLDILLQCKEAKDITMQYNLVNESKGALSGDIAITFDSDGFATLTRTVSSECKYIQFKLSSETERLKTWAIYVVSHVDGIMADLEQAEYGNVYAERIPGDENMLTDIGETFLNGHVGITTGVGQPLTYYASVKTYTELKIVRGKFIKLYYEGKLGEGNMSYASTKFVITQGYGIGIAIVLAVNIVQDFATADYTVLVDEANHYVVVSYDKILEMYPTATHVYADFDNVEGKYYVKYIDNFPRELDWVRIASDQVYDRLGTRSINPALADYMEAKFADKYYNFTSFDYATRQSCFCTMPDIHENYDALRYIGRLQKHYPLIKNHVFATTMAGDLMHGGTTYARTATIEILQKYAAAISESGIRVLTCLGDHDYGNGCYGSTLDNDKRNHVDYCLTKADQRQYIINPAVNSMPAGTVFISDDENVCYYYAKDTTSKTIYIMTDEMESPTELLENGQYYKYDRNECNGYSYAQLMWIGNILSTVEDGWKVCVFNHSGVWKLTTDTTTTIGGNTFIKRNNLGNTVVGLYSMLKAYKDRTSVTLPANEFLENEVSFDFSGANGKLVGLFCGHIHHSELNTGRGFNVVASNNGGWYPYGLNEPRMADSPLTYASDFFFCDNVANTLKSLRFGRRADVDAGTTTGCDFTVTGDRFMDGTATF